jgi:hypothetical protein
MDKWLVSAEETRSMIVKFRHITNFTFVVQKQLLF